jgi:hypothetical protein
MNWIFLPFFGLTLIGWAWIVAIFINRYLNPGVTLCQQLKHEAASGEVLWAILLLVAFAAGAISWLEIVS